MKLDELRTVQSKERRKDSLQQLRDSFYEDVAAYIQDLTASRDRRAEQVSNPFSDDEVRRLSDELETAEEVAEAVYERRVGKVVKLASFAAADMPVDDEGMTSEERRLFEDLVARIEQNKRAVLDVLSGDSESSSTTEVTAAETSPTEATDAEPTPPPSPTERVAEAETEADAGASADGMLADAMGSTADSAEPVTDSGSQPPTESAAPSAGSAVQEPDTGAGSSEPAAQSAAGVPPQDTEPEPDVVLGSADGTTTDEAVANSTPAAEPSAAERSQPEPDGGTRSTTDGGTVTGSPAATAEPTAASPDPSAVNVSSGETHADTTDASSSDTTTSDAGATADTEARTTLRITRDVGNIFGVDGREYTLRSEDVVTLPTANAEPLVDRDAAMRLE